MGARPCGCDNITSMGILENVLFQRKENVNRRALQLSLVRQCTSVCSDVQIRPASSRITESKHFLVQSESSLVYSQEMFQRSEGRNGSFLLNGSIHTQTTKLVFFFKSVEFTRLGIRLNWFELAPKTIFACTLPTHVV